MRDTFVKTVYELAKQDERIVLIVADIGIYLHRNFKKDFPDRFINVGISEANMVGIAAGLAMSGKIPFVYTIPPFITARALDQVRVDLCYQNLNVKLVGVGAGIGFSTWGPTHHAIEDIAVMRSLPNMNVLSPSDQFETDKIIRYSLEYAGPSYTRLAVGGTQIPRERFSLGVELLKDGSSMAIIATGRVVYNALKAGEIVDRTGIKSKVININTIKPLDRTELLKLIDGAKAVFTVEEHNIIGGLGSAVAEVLAEEDCGVPLERIGLKDEFCTKYGSVEYLDDQYGLSPEKIAETIKKRV